MAPPAAVEELLLVEEGGVRLDSWVTQHLPQTSRTEVQRWIAAGQISVNGLPAKKRLILARGDEVEVHGMPPPPSTLEPEPLPLDILFEDEALLVLHKPAGLVVHPGAGHSSGTLAHGLLYHCAHLPGEAIRPGLVHRLDKDTSGVMVVAKSTEALHHLLGQFQERSVKKCYLAVAKGTLDDGSCDLPIGRDPVHRQRMAVRPEGRPALTAWQVIAREGGLALAEVRPVTGRTHQIRVHCRAQGAPLLGDTLYGGPAWQGRHWLHAWSLSLTHPTLGTRCTFRAAPPAELLAGLPPALRLALAPYRSEPLGGEAGCDRSFAAVEVSGRKEKEAHTAG